MTLVRAVLFLMITIWILPSGVAQETSPDTSDIIYEMPQIDVIGRKPGVLDRIPGSGSLVDSKHLRRVDPLNGNEVFRQITGLHTVDEEGAGLRLNLGVRGLEPDRSRSILMLEDGIPISLAPYGEPEMYYTPSIDRMSGLEVLKGSGSILFGPQTIGGVINYITADPPSIPTGLVRLRGGENGLFTSLLQFGTTVGNVGTQLNYLRRQGDHIGTTQYRIDDLTMKFRLALGSNTVAGLKAAAYDETSNSTYVGLTQTMFDQGIHYQHVAPDDELLIRRYSLSGTVHHSFSPRFYFRTTAFGYTTSRNWRRQDFDRSPVSGRQYVGFEGDTSVAGGALYMRNSTGNRNRQFEVLGIEPRFTLHYAVVNHRNELDFGGRFLYERAFEQYVIGTKFNSSSGDMRDDEIRTGVAQSAFVQNRIYLSDRLMLTPGIRLESFSYERLIRRGRFLIGTTNQVRDTNVVGGSSLSELIPGLGVAYAWEDGSSIFAGVHRGFAPPRVKDAITGHGESLELDAELSWNYEAGVRYTGVDGLSAEATLFLLDFSNQVIPVSQSSGGTGTGLVNGGRSRHVGLESGLSAEVGRWLLPRYTLNVSINATYVKATYNADRFVQLVNIKGNSLPYAPEWTFSGSLAAGTPFGLDAQVSVRYVGDQFADELNTVAPPATGLVGAIPAYSIVDVSTNYTIPGINTRVSLAVKNITDERYIVTRRPEGIRVGLPRMISAGIDYSF